MDSTLNDRASLQVDGVAALPSGRRRSSRDSTTAARPAQILMRQGTVADTPCRFDRRMNAGEGPGIGLLRLGELVRTTSSGAVALRCASRLATWTPPRRLTSRQVGPISWSKLRPSTRSKSMIVTLTSPDAARSTARSRPAKPGIL